MVLKITSSCENKFCFNRDWLNTRIPFYEKKIFCKVINMVLNIYCKKLDFTFYFCFSIKSFNSLIFRGIFSSLLGSIAFNSFLVESRNLLQQLFPYFHVQIHVQICITVSSPLTSANTTHALSTQFFFKLPVHSSLNFQGH